MSCWVVCPSARPVEHVAKWAAAWGELGYDVAIVVDSEADAKTKYECDARIIISPPAGEAYRGYARSINALITFISEREPYAEWFVAAGDDVYPDPNHTADEIALECLAHFTDSPFEHGTFGVMQPTGDREFGDKQGPYIDRVAGSAWIGREFAKRVNQGNGPLWPEYFHMGCDEELQAVATKLGVFWQRPDLMHFHRHWGRPQEGERMGKRERMPAFLTRANSPEEWDRYKKLFREREAAGFPGSDPL